MNKMKSENEERVHMLKDLKSVTEIDKFFDEELPKKANWRFQRAQIYNMAREYQIRRQKESEIEKLVEKDYRRVINCTIVSDDIAIIEAESRVGSNNEILYYPVVFGKALHESCMNFDEALILAICHKYGFDRHAPQMIYNMLRMDLGSVKDRENK